MIFAGLYNKVMRWAAHPHAERYLVGVSIFESIFFPIPTAMMVAPTAPMAPRTLGVCGTIPRIAGNSGGKSMSWRTCTQRGNSSRE